ncbi:MAG: alpha/beta hydrolase [Pseudomonadota bacterium]
MKTDVTGTGSPVLIFIHGFASGAEDWDPIVAHFSKTATCVAVTLRAHGNTTRGEKPLAIRALADDVAADIAAQDYRDVILVGHSMGTRIAAEVAVLCEDRVKGIVLVDGSNMAQVGRAAALSTFDDALAKTGYATFTRGLFEAMFFDDAHDELRRRLVSRALDFGDENGTELYRSLVSWDAERFAPCFAKLTQPLLIIQATTRGADGIRRSLGEDEVGTYEHLVRSHRPDAEVVSLPGHGHFVTYEAPDVCNRAIAGWMSSLG